MGKINRTFSLTDEYNEIFETRRNEEGMTVTTFFEHLIDTEHKKAEIGKTVEVIKDNPEHLARIAELEEKITTKENEFHRISLDYEDIISGLKKDIDDHLEKMQANMELWEPCKQKLIDNIQLSLSPEAREILKSYFLPKVNKERRNRDLELVDESMFFSSYIEGCIMKGIAFRIDVPKVVVENLSNKVKKGADSE